VFNKKGYGNFQNTVIKVVAVEPSAPFTGVAAGRLTADERKVYQAGNELTQSEVRGLGVGLVLNF
jgi:hypothetical protein